jgi:lipopolysaccharide biosynthesis glycosyltransferase
MRNQRGVCHRHKSTVKLVKLFQRKATPGFFIAIVLYVALYWIYADRTPPTHVFLATDSPDLRPLLVAVNSSFSNSRNTNLKFVIFVPKHLASKVQSSFDRLLPHVKNHLEIDHRSLPVQRIIDLPGVLPTERTKRRELANPFNFAAYYIPSMPKYAHLSKAIYLDTDVVVQDDLAILAAECCLPGTAAAVVEDCSQPFRTYVNITRLEEILSHAQEGLTSRNAEFDRLKEVRNSCVFNRGVVVLELENWRTLDITYQIEEWMALNSRKGDLYFHGVSQPPFLLALLGRYTPLQSSWNTRGLGREKMTQKEVDLLVSQGMGQYIGESGHRDLHPYLVPFADVAKVLHFTGKLKPWLSGRNSTIKVSICGEKLLPCSDYWWRFISNEADSYLIQSSSTLPGGGNKVA